jgi:hypothetical protein
MGAVREFATEQSKPGDAFGSGAPRALGRERAFFTGMAMAMTVIAFVGFAPSYYLKPYFGVPPQLTPLLHAHGVAATLWMLLLPLQARLIAANRRQTHRTLGAFGAVVAAAMIGLAVTAAVVRVRSGLLGAVEGGPPPTLVLALALGGSATFSALIGAALFLRNRPDAHKRLILIGTLDPVNAAMARVPGVLPLGLPAFFALTDLFIVAIALYDWSKFRRIHPATVFGAGILVASQAGRVWISETATWSQFVTWLTS